MEPGEDLSGKVQVVEQKLDQHINDNTRHLAPPEAKVTKPVEPGDVQKAKKKGSLFGDPILVIE
jgi:hypothetical protein